MSVADFFSEKLNISPKVVAYCNSILDEIRPKLTKFETVAEINHAKVLSAFKNLRLSEGDLAPTNGYGYGDAGRDKLEAAYSQIFETEDTLVRAQVISGTHAISLALFGNLRYGDELILGSGLPYDTLQGVIGMRKTPGSLVEHGITHKVIPLNTHEKIDINSLISSITAKTRIVAFQRSRGYSLRNAFSPQELGDAIRAVKSINDKIICFVDNCYGEFVNETEPTNHGVDLMAGSLIKNIGGGIAPVGGYITGKKQFVENAAYRLTAPGLGKEAGPSLGATLPMFQGLSLASDVTSSALKGAEFAAALFESLGFETFPKFGSERHDIVQSIKLGTPQLLSSFCEGIQSGSPVDSFVAPKPWDMPGYDCKIIMAAGGFVSGSSIELSADAPMREPYAVFMQGGLTFSAAKLGIIVALNHLVQNNLIHLP